MSKLFAALFILKVSNYFYGPIKLFSNLYLAKFIDSTKLFFWCGSDSFFEGAIDKWSHDKRRRSFFSPLADIVFSLIEEGMQ